MSFVSLVLICISTLFQ